MPEQAFAGVPGVKIFISSLPGQARPGWQGLAEEEEKKEVHERDVKLRANLETHLALLHRKGLLTLWHDGKLKGGKSWEREITSHLESAQIILLLLSPEFFASAFCYAQMEQALAQQARGARVLPIYLRPVVGIEDFPISHLAALPAHGRPVSEAPETAWNEVARDLRALILGQELFTPLELTGPPEQAVYRDVLLKRPPVPLSAALLPRTQLVETLYQRLTSTDTTTGLLLTGLNGTGKTTVAALVHTHAGQQCQTITGPFTQPPLWCDIEPTITLIDVIYSLGKACGQTIPSLASTTARELAEMLYTLLEHSRRLVIFDHLENWLDPQSGQERPEHAGVNEWLSLLQTGSQEFSGRVLLTSHFYPHRLFPYGDAAGLHHHTMPHLEPAEGLQLLRMEQVPALLQATDGELAHLVVYCQGHPQTLAWLRQLCKRNASLRVADFVTNHRAEGLWLHDIFSRTIESIYTGQLKPAQRTLLQAFEIYREAVPLEAALALAIPQRGHSADLPLVLLDLGLLQAFESGLHRLHPVVAGFVRKKSSPRSRAAMHLKAARYYQHRFGQSHTRNRSIMDNEEHLHSVVEAIWHLCRADQRDEAYQLMQETALFKQLYRQGYNSTLLALYLELLAAPTWHPEPSQAARISNELGEIRSALGQKSEALHDYQHALALFRGTDEAENIVETLNNLGAIHRALGDDQQAQQCYEEALRICAETPVRLVQQGTTFNNLGRLAYERGDQARRKRESNQASTRYREALDYYQQALTSYRTSSLPDEEAIALNHLGDASLALGKREQALDYYQQALSSFQSRKDRRGEALSLNNLGRLYQNMPDDETDLDYPTEACACYEQALRLFRSAGDRWQESITLGNLGRFYPTYDYLEEHERYQRSLACLILAARLASSLHRPQQVQIPLWIAETVRHWLAGLDNQPPSYEAFLRDVEIRAEDIMREEK